jgi:hypothetical protein
MPIERKLDDEEEEELIFLLQDALELTPPVEDVNVPEQVVRSIRQFIDETREKGYSPEKLEEISFRIGALWGDQLHRELGWPWVHLTYEDGFDVYAVVSPDRSRACFPMHLVYKILVDPQKENVAALLFNMLRSGDMPQLSANSYSTIG